MPQLADPTINSTASAVNDHARVDWRYPLGILTTSFVLMGASAFCRLLPVSAEHAKMLTLAVWFAWSYGMHLANIFPWGWRASWINSFHQGVLNALAGFVFFMAVLSWQGGKPTSVSVLLAALGSLLAVLFSIRSKAAMSLRPHSSSS
jgi:hypothetical protein